jgi:hypothetical protein
MEREGWQRSFTLCSDAIFSPYEEVLQTTERELLEENCGTLAERYLRPLLSAIGCLIFLRPQLRGGEERLKGNLSLHLCLGPASGLRAPLFGTFAPRHIGWTVLAVLDGDVGVGTLRKDCSRLGERTPRDATSWI